MRHATVYAIEELLHRGRDVPALSRAWVNASAITACSWERLADAGAHSGHFNDDEAAQLLAGERIDLITCPACAALVDLALELRGA